MPPSSRTTGADKPSTVRSCVDSVTSDHARRIATEHRRNCPQPVAPPMYVCISRFLPPMNRGSEEVAHDSIKTGQFPPERPGIPCRSNQSYTLSHLSPNKPKLSPPQTRLHRQPRGASPPPDKPNPSRWQLVPRPPPTSPSRPPAASATTSTTLAVTPPPRRSKRRVRPSPQTSGIPKHASTDMMGLQRTRQASPLSPPTPARPALRSTRPYDMPLTTPSHLDLDPWARANPR